MKPVFLQAISELHEAGCTNILIIATTNRSGSTEVLYDYGGVDGGDTLAVLGMLEFVPAVLQCDVMDGEPVGSGKGAGAGEDDETDEGDESDVE